MQGCIREQRHTNRKLPGMYTNNHKGQAMGGQAGHVKGIRVCLLRSLSQSCVIHGLFVF